MISLGSSGSGGPSGSEAQAEGSGQIPTSHSDTTMAPAMDSSVWTEQTSENGQVESSEGAIGRGIAGTHGPSGDMHVEMDESGVYPEDWVRDMVGEADPEQTMEPQRNHNKGAGRLPPHTAMAQAVSY